MNKGDEENARSVASQEEKGTTAKDNKQSQRRLLTPITLGVLIALIILNLTWGAVMTGLYVQEINSRDTAADTTADTTLRFDENTLGVGAISHINVVVNDSVDIGAAYYKEILGFERASNKDGPMDYRNITNNGFCVDAGFDTCRVDIIFLKHPIINLYLELFYYYEPVGDLDIVLKKTNDAGGIRHVALEVSDAVNTYNQLKAKDHQGTFITKDTPIPLTPFPYTFFYWIDKYGVQWEFEQGRPVEYYKVAGITG
jgi:catechol 2,3-dioxygenase-like lactoylglutathione lyase family enzyme